MDARHTNLLKFIQDARQFVIPIYQRKYSWEQAQCEQLWKDIVRAGTAEGAGGHFIGSIVYIADNDSHNSPLLVIDGQQRLTTLSLMIAALSQVIAEDEEPFDGFSRPKLRGHYLMNLLESGNKSRKLILSDDDRETLFSIVDGRDKPEDASVRVVQNFDFFHSKIEEAKSDLKTICRGLSKLLVVYVALSRKEDNPQLIFESMNSTGRRLSQADLIRNFVLMGLEPELQTNLYTNYWQPMEKGFGQEAYDSHFDGFMRHYLTMKTGEIPRLDDVYVAFKDFARAADVAANGVEELVKDVRKYAGYYVAMALGSENHPDLKPAFHDLRELKVDVAYPFLLELYNDYKVGVLPPGDFVEATRLVETYVFRRAICMIPTNSLNKTFATFTKAVLKDRYLESIKAQFQMLPSYRRFPSDEEFQRDIQSRDLYNFRSRSYWLRRFENFKRKELVPVDEYTIEHIMPQNEALSDAWKVDLGEDWLRVHQVYLHTIGNLTLTGYNSEYSDRPFTEKRDMEGGFRDSPIRLNEGLGVLEQWDEEAMLARAGRLALKALTVWPAPNLPADTFEAYNGSKGVPTKYTIADHPNLQGGITRQLFDAIRKEILALDPCVAEGFTKHYVAFKAETNFVDIVPQAQTLLLILNIKFPEINDPRNICRDLTGIGRWGNGDVELKLAALEEIPYAMGLVRQSLEQQLGDSGDQ
jgi:uncharacterized protein with ParB-like and HNH nuclease domain/predicted transport protein